MTTEEMRLYTVAQVADMAGVSKSTVLREINAQRLPGKKFGRGFKVPAYALRPWMDALPDVGPDRPATVL